MPSYRVCVSRFPGNEVEHHESSGWLMSTIPKMAKDSRISEIVPFKVSTTPITKGRNKACRFALEQKCDYIMMIDADQVPDMPGEEPFWDTTWEWLMKHRDEPHMVAAPYCGPSPFNNIYVFRYRSQNDKIPRGWSLEQFSREETLTLRGIQEVGALPTGLIVIDTRVYIDMKKSLFQYEYVDEWEDELASTEDVFFVRNASLAWHASGGKVGGRAWCNWSSWAGHKKYEIIGRPQAINPASVGEDLKQAVLLGQRLAPKPVMVQVDPIHGARLGGERVTPVTASKLIDEAVTHHNNGDFAKHDQLLDMATEAANSESAAHDKFDWTKWRNADWRTWEHVACKAKTSEEWLDTAEFYSRSNHNGMNDEMIKVSQEMAVEAHKYEEATEKFIAFHGGNVAKKTAESIVARDLSDYAKMQKTNGDVPHSKHWQDRRDPEVNALKVASEVTDDHFHDRSRELADAIREAAR